MLVLNRYVGESIIIEGCIEVKVVKVTHKTGNIQVTLGVTAPKKISVHRKEIQEAVNREAKSGNVK